MGTPVEIMPELASINIIDRNGLTETISNKDRLKQYENVDFLVQQPYQKVLRTYKRDPEGNVLAYITSYHPNGNLSQYLEVLNNRAYGVYQEWHPNGKLKLNTLVIGGVADIDLMAEKSWLFDGCSKIWNEEGQLIATIPYVHGELEGVSTYFHASGAIWKTIPYQKNQIEGSFIVYLENGTLFQVVEYVRGKKHGLSTRYWDKDKIAADELYCDGLLKAGKYYDQQGELLQTIEEGFGFRVIFGKRAPAELHEYRNGLQEGRVEILNEKGDPARIYHVKEEIKHGEEIIFYENKLVKGKSTSQPKLSMNWAEGVIQGAAKTWYPSGVQESQREMSNNVKNGLLTAWYKDSSVMLIEEYDRDKLVKGEYYLPGEGTPISTITAGRGTATIFDADGNFQRKISYVNGKPSLQ